MPDFILDINCDQISLCHNAKWSPVNERICKAHPWIIKYLPNGIPACAMATHLIGQTSPARKPRMAPVRRIMGGDPMEPVLPLPLAH